MISSILHAFGLTLTYDRQEDRRTDDATINKILLFYHMKKKMESMLPWVCTAKDHRRSQNVVRTSVTHLAAACVLLFCSYHILTIDIFYWTDAQQHSIHLLNCQMIEMIVLFHNAIRQICSIIVPDFYGSFAIRQHPLTWQHILAMPA